MTTITLPPPAGRSLLMWEGKRTLREVDAPPVRCVEAFAPAGERLPPALIERNRLYFGDNKAALAHLLATGARGQVQLIYIDPPFDSNADYVRKIRLRNAAATQVGTEVQYRDRWTGDSYLQFMYERLLLLRELLAEDGVIWLHCDYRQVHRLHLILEEVFGPENYLNTVSWRSQVARGAKVNAFYFPYSTQYLEIFAKNRRAPTRWHPPKKQLTFTRRQAAAQFMEDEGGFFRTSDPGTYSFERLKALHEEGRLYAPYGGQVVVDEEARRVYASNGGNIGVKYYLTKLDNGRYGVERGVDNLWDDIPGLGTTPGEDVGYPTQKTAALLRRIIGASTDPGDWVLDAFSGSGATAAVSQAMGRRWIACDANYGAIQTAHRRLAAAEEAAGFAVYAVGDETLPPAMEASSVRVDLQIQPVGAIEDTIGIDGARMMEVRIVDFCPADLNERLPDRHRHMVTDWRALVDGVEIDPAYDGHIFRPTLVDFPQSRRAQVDGVYRLPAPPAPTAVAVRVTDVWGREYWVTRWQGDRMTR